MLIFADVGIQMLLFCVYPTARPVETPLSSSGSRNHVFDVAIIVSFMMLMKMTLFYLCLCQNCDQQQANICVEAGLSE